MSTNKNSKMSAAYLIVSLCLTAVSVVLRALDLFFFFDSDLGYYTSGAILPIVANVLLFAGVIFFIVFSFIFFRKEKVEYKTARSVPERAILIAAAVCSAVLTVSNAVDIILKDRSSVVLFIVSAFCTVYFITDFFNFKKETKVELGAIFLVRLTIMLATSYFDQNVQMNSPDKLLFGIACVAAMFFIVSEMKVAVGSARPAVHIIASSSAALLCSASAIPSIIAYPAGRLPASGDVYFEYFLLLGVAVLAVFRLISVMSAIKNGKASPKADSKEMTATVSEDAEQTVSADNSETNETKEDTEN